MNKKKHFFSCEILYIYKRNKQYIAPQILREGTLTMARVLISMPEKFLDEIDNLADTENRSRSELIREALRTYIHRNRVRENTLATKNAATLEALLD